MASQAERRLIGVMQNSLKLSFPVTSASFHVPRRGCFKSNGMIYLDQGGRERVRKPDDPRLAKLPDGPKLGVDSTERVPYTYGGKVRPHYHVFRQLWPEPTLLKRKFGLKADPAKMSKALDHVEVPMRKTRSSTAVLEALASTVHVESNSVPHDLLDDPYLLPLQKFQMADYRGAKASGRRIAKRIAEDLPYFFDHKFFRPDPMIHALESGASDWEHVMGEDGTAQFDDLIRERLEAGRLDLAFSAYSASLEQKTQLSADVLASLFEAAAYHNLTLDTDYESLRPSELEEAEEQNVSGIRDKDSMTEFLGSVNSSRDDLWEPSGIAEDIWRRIPKTDELHCVFIQALVRHGATQRAYDHFITMIEEGKVVDLPTFNALLTRHNEIDTEAQTSLYEGINSPKNFEGRVGDLIYQKILKIMAHRGIRPTTATFNAVLNGLADQRLPFRRFQAESVLIEMIDLRLRPTLGTLGLMVTAWRSSSENIIRQLDWLLRIAETGRLEAGTEDDYDCMFFPFALSALGLRDVQFSPEIPDLVKRMHDLVRTNPLCRAAATRKYNVFHYFAGQSIRTLFRNGHVDEAMEVFSTYVPNFFSPGTPDWLSILTPAAEAGTVSVRHVVTLGNEFSSPLHYGVDRTADAFTSLLNPRVAEDESELQALVAVAANYFRGYQRVQDLQKKKEKRDEYNVYGPELPRRETVRLSGFAYGNLIFVLAHGDPLDDAMDVFTHYMKEAHHIIGVPPVEGVALLMRRVAKSPKIANSRKGRFMVEALKFLDEVGAQRHLAEGLDLMVEEVTLDAPSALIVTQLKKQVELPPREAQN